MSRMMTGNGLSTWKQKFKDDELNVIDLFSDEETTNSPEITTESASPNRFFDTDILDFGNSLELDPNGPEFGSQAMDLFDSEDDDTDSGCSLATPAEITVPSLTVESPQLSNREVEELKLELTRLNEDKRVLAEECAQNQKSAEGWKRQFDEASSRNKIVEALVEGQQKDIELLKNEACMLLETVERLGGTIASNNGRMFKERREERLQAKQQLEQSALATQKLQQELEEHKVAAKHTAEGIKSLNDKLKAGREWIKQYKTQTDLRIRQLEDQSQSLRSNSKEIQEGINLHNTSTNIQPADGTSKSQSRLTENESDSLVEQTSHAFICLWEYCNQVCPDKDSLRSHMLEEHM